MNIITDHDEVFAFMAENQPCEREAINMALGFADENGMYAAVVFYGESPELVLGPENLPITAHAWHAGYILPGRSWVRGIFQAVYQGGFARYATILSSTRVDNERANDLNVQMGMQIIETQYNPDGTPTCHTYSMTREQCRVLFES